MKDEYNHSFIFESSILLSLLSSIILWIMYAINYRNWIAFAIVVIFNILFIIIMIMFFNKFEDLKKQVVRDSMTQIYNWKFIKDFINSEIERCKRTNKRFGVIHFDIDDFKNINDHYGHQIGDQVLIKVVRSVETIIRPYDVFGRLGGEEFSIILPEIDETYLLKVSERIRQSVEKIEVNSTNITISIGATLSKEKDDYFSLYKRADDAMYTAKNKGKNTVEFI